MLSIHFVCFHFLPAEQENILKEIIKDAVLRMYQIALFWQISGMRKFYLTKIFPKILN